MFVILIQLRDNVDVLQRLFAVTCTDNFEWFRIIIRNEDGKLVIDVKSLSWSDNVSVAFHEQKELRMFYGRKQLWFYRFSG